MKEKVLVYGLKDPAGGVEHVVLEYVKAMTAQFAVTFDFIVFEETFSLREEIEALGCRVCVLPVRRRDPAGYRKAMEALFADNRYAAVWGNYSGLTNIDILCLAKRYGIPVRIAHSHVSQLYWGSPIMKYVVYLLHHWNKLRLTRYATHYFACSQVARDFMMPRKVWDETIFLRNGVDVTRFYPNEKIRRSVRESFGIPENSTVVGHVARMCQVKNQAFLLDVMAKVVELESQAKLLLVGDGELRQQLEERTAQLGLQDAVIFTGNRKDVPDLLRAMDVYVLTSFSEGLSVSAVEAQACGLPCVLSASVSEETDISGGVRFVPLEESAETWVKHLLAQAKNRIVDPGQKLAEHGYEIGGAARNLYKILIGDHQ